MCEPAQSTLQYRDDDFPLDTTPNSVMERLGSFGKKIAQWFHVSKIGKGHSECAIDRSLTTLFLRPTKWEGEWWHRTTRLDEWYIVKIHPGQREAAEEYTRGVCYADLGTLRRYLERAMKVTSNEFWSYYLDRFELLFNEKGRHELEKSIRRHFPGLTIQRAWNTAQRDQAINLVVGMTRKRRLLNPAWADDHTLWGK